MQYNPQIVQELFRTMNSPAGQQLIAMLKRSGGNELENALSKAENGDYADAQKTLTLLLNDPNAKKLLEQLGR